MRWQNWKVWAAAAVVLGALPVFTVAAHAATISSGTLIKASGSAVYYYADNGRRYVFPTERTYLTWYADFSGVQRISDSELAAILIGGNVTYRPGVRLVKVTTDPRVYAVDINGTLRWITSESVAVDLYGPDWNRQIDDLPDPFFINYTVGGQIQTAADFNRSYATNSSATISVELGLRARVGLSEHMVTVEADDAGLYPATVAVRRGERVQLTFKVRTLGVAVGGLTFRSALFSDVSVSPGGMVTVTFTPQQAGTFELKSYWAGTIVLRTTGQIIVE